MDLQDGGSYRAPNGKVFRAKMEYRRYAPESAWTFVPIKLNDTYTWRDSLEELLFLEDGRIFRFEFSGPEPKCVDTGWKTDDFVVVE